MNETRNRIIAEAAESVDIPPSAYEKAQDRYEALGNWFGRKEAHCCKFKPHIYAQGSFRLGTVIRPVDKDGEYDLDMGCRLTVGVTKSSHSQKQLKELVGLDLEEYRVSQGIKEKKEEKHRCWRLKYADLMKFHLDTVPSIPETTELRRSIQAEIENRYVPSEIAKSVADLTGAITDNRNANYGIVHHAWRLSNSEGFAFWFRSRMKLAKGLMESRAIEARAAKVDDLPTHSWKSPLQRCVQLLKRHRDIMFANDPDGKPASIIITTLSAKAYNGESEIGDALATILSIMGTLVGASHPRVPNPVNPKEDFADRWADPASRHHKLEEKFFRWLRQAQQDFDTLGKERSPEKIAEFAKIVLGSSLSADELRRKIQSDQSGGLLHAAAMPAGLSFPNKPLIPQKPAGFA